MNCQNQHTVDKNDVIFLSFHASRVDLPLH